MKKILQGNAATLIQASGKIVLTRTEVIEATVPVIFFKKYTDEYDMESIIKSNGVVTMVGGTLSHASIVAREFDKACIVNCEGLEIDIIKKYIKIKDLIIPSGTDVFIDGTTGSVYIK